MVGTRWNLQLIRSSEHGSAPHPTLLYPHPAALTKAQDPISGLAPLPNKVKDVAIQALEGFTL